MILKLTHTLIRLAQEKSPFKKYYLKILDLPAPGKVMNNFLVLNGKVVSCIASILFIPLVVIAPFTEILTRWGLSGRIKYKENYERVL